MCKSSMQRRKRNGQTGNLLVLICVAMTILAVGILVAASFAGLFFAHNRLQTSADEIALAGACKLNEFNRLGQMNDMIARSRQLAFGSNKQYDLAKAPGNDQLLEKLTYKLSNEARDAAILLDQERHKLALQAADEAGQVMQNRFNKLKGGYAMVLPWLQVEAPQMVSGLTGKIIDMPSNSQQLQGFAELVAKENRHVVSGKPVNLYGAEVDAQIDSFLHFKFSPLAAPVVNDMSPARVVLPERFDRSRDDYAPCATQVELALKVGTALGARADAAFKVKSAATAAGGGLWN